MAQKEIKVFNIGSDTGKIDWVDGIVNKPYIITPKTVNLKINKVEEVADANILTLNSYKYYQSATVYDEDPVDIKTAAQGDGAALMARHSDFGYISDDGTGSVQFAATTTEGYVIQPTFGTGVAYKNFKTPYLTCINNMYKMTKVTAGGDVTLAAVQESTLEAYNITYNLTITQPTEGDAITAKLTTYRCEDAAIAGYAGMEKLTAAGTATDYSYSKETGYKDKSTSDVGNAQINFKLEHSTLPDGYQVQVTYSAKNFNKLEENSDHPGLWKATKVSGDFTVNIAIKPLATYTVTYNAGTYPFVNDVEPTEAPTSATEGSSFVFSFYQNSDKSKGSEDIPAATALAKLSSVTIGGTAYTVTESMISSGKKKAQVTLPGEAITGNLVITTKTEA